MFVTKQSLYRAQPLQVQTDANLFANLDVDRDGSVSHLDALVLINYLNRSEFEQISFQNSDSSLLSRFDVNRDTAVTSVDVLIIINRLNRTVDNLAIGEGEATGVVQSASRTADSDVFWSNYMPESSRETAVRQAGWPVWV